MAKETAPGQSQPFVKLRSRPFSRRVGLIPMTIALVLSWTLAAGWYVVVWFTAPYNASIASVVGALTSAFVIYLALVTYHMIRDAFKEYSLEVTTAQAVLTVRDNISGATETKRVLLDDVDRVEYYSAEDTASLVFLAGSHKVEMPLWPMGKNRRDVVDFLRGQGIPILEVPA